MTEQLDTSFSMACYSPQKTQPAMPHLEDITVNSIVKGLVPNSAVTIKHTEMFGSQAMQVTFVDAEGRPGTQLIYRDQESALEIVRQTRPLSFSADPKLFRLASEAQRLRWGFLFDPMIAVTTSSIEPLPHQITAVYETMLNRQPLRFLEADDPGAGKTIMAGLLIKELIIRGDVAKCLIVAPGSLVEQWQDELDQKFDLAFDIMTNDAIQASRTGNWFLEHNLCICRLDKLSRNEDVQERLKQVDWDLVVVDEAHKMSASFFASEVRYTKRFRLGQLLSQRTRQFLLLTATPAQRERGGFPAFHVAHRWRSLRGPLPRRWAQPRLLRYHAPHGEGESCYHGGEAAFPGTIRVHGFFSIVSRRGRALRQGDQLRPRRIQSSGPPGQ